MSKQESKTDEFYGWLHERMLEADLTPGEVVELTRWIMVRDCRNPETGHEDSHVTFSEIVELIGWMQGRMNSLFVKDDEKSEFSDWLKKRLKAHSCLTDEQMQEVLAKLVDRT